MPVAELSKAIFHVFVQDRPRIVFLLNYIWMTYKVQTSELWTLVLFLTQLQEGILQTGWLVHHLLRSVFAKKNPRSHHSYLQQKSLAFSAINQIC